MSAINTQTLSRVAVEYNDVLRTLPAFKFDEVAKELGINSLVINGKNVKITAQRKAGILRPYVPGLTHDGNKELVKFFEATLDPQLVYGEVIDNITNYKDVKLMSNKGETLNLIDKEHPAESLMLQSAVTSMNEEIVFNMFFAERDTHNPAPSTSFNGFYTKYDMLVTAGEIAAGKGNLVTTGALSAPVDGSDTTAYDALVNFVKSAHPMLRQGEVLLYISLGALQNARDAFRNKVKSFEYSTTDDMIARLKDDAMCPGLKVISHIALGTGSKLTLTKPGNLDFGMLDSKSKDYVQVRAPFQDPNQVQFWIEAAFDTRINDVNAKVFLTNEQTATGVDFAGDYQDTQVVEEEEGAGENQVI